MFRPVLRSQPEPSQKSDAKDEGGRTSENPGGGKSARRRGGGGQPQNLGPLAQMLLSQDRNRDRGRDGERRERGDPVRHPLSSPSVASFPSRVLEQMGIERLRDDLDNLTATNPALAERLTNATDGLREAVREPLAQALLLYGREEDRKPPQRNPAQRAAVADRAATDRADARADPPDRTPPARAFLQAAQAPAARPSRRAPHAAPQRGLGQRALPHRLEAQASRQTEDRRALRRLGLGGAGVGFLPAADPQPARGRVRRPLLCLFRASDRGQRHPGIQESPEEAMRRDHVQGRLRLVRLRLFLRRFRTAMDGER